MSRGDTLALVSKLQALHQLVDESGYGALASRIKDELDKLQADRFHLVVLGQFKRGKTTFINALLGEELLPVGVVPVTSVVTLMRHGTEQRCEVVFSDGRRMGIQPRDLQLYVTEQGNPKNHKGARYVEVTHPSPLLHEGIVLVDTPGIGSLYVHNTETTQDFVPSIDAAVVVLSADLPITHAEYQFLDEVAAHVNKLFFVLNKIDLLTPLEMKDVLSYTHSILAEKLKVDRLSIVPLSARNALEGQRTGALELLERSNLAEFKATIETFVREGKEHVFFQRSLERTTGLIAEAQFATELELRAMTTPPADLRSRIEEFDRQIGLISADRENFRYLLNGQITSLNRWIEEQLDRLSSAETQELRRTLNAWVVENAYLPLSDFERQLHSLLASELIHDFESWRWENEKLIADKYNAIVSGFASQTNNLIHRVLQLSADLFRIRLRPFERVLPIEWKETFGYKIEDDPLFLEFDTIKIGATLLPGKVIRKRITRHILSQVPDKVSRHCGRLRYEYEYSIQESYRAFQSDLNRKLDSVVDQIRTTLCMATRMLSEQEETASLHVQGIQRRMDRLTALRTTPVLQ